jgi:spermidine dehydrogenase
MSQRDRDLGMDRPISRRDFLNGVGVIAAGAVTSGCVGPGGSTPGAPSVGADTYPPLRSGLRGSHVGSFEVAHQLAFEGRQDWGDVAVPDGGVYDLVVVGGGISGLASAYFQLQRDPGSKILILENHDDFGGHAKRNEFQLGDQTILGYGGSQSLESPSWYSDVSKGLLEGIGVELTRFDKTYDEGFYRRHGLRGGVYFDRATYGVDRVVPIELLDFSSYLPLSSSKLSKAEAVAQMPLSEPARRELLRLLETHGNRLPNIPPDEQADFLSKISYRDFLSRYLDVSEPEVFALLEGIATDMGVTLDTAPALTVIGYVGLPGFQATALPADQYEYEPYIAHFPDGNASIARLLVRGMIGAAAPGSTMDDIVDAPFDYAKLDLPGADVRLRLGSTVVQVQNEGSPDSGVGVAITYVREGRAARVRARGCVLAGYNAMIPYLCPELPAEQREALSLSVKSPILYTTVLLNNWRAWEKIGIGAMSAPGSYHANAMLDFPVSLGGYAFSASPDDPIVVHMERFGKAQEAGLSPRQQFKAERRRLLSTPFEDIEREVRTQLAGSLGAGGFDPVADIEAITVNRWAHGYIVFPHPDVHSPHRVRGRQRIGRISFAGADAAGSPWTQGAFQEAHRAVHEQLAL